MTDARRAQAVAFMNAFMDGPSVASDQLRPSEGTLSECGSDSSMAWMEHHTPVDLNVLIPAETRLNLRAMSHRHAPLRINDDLEMLITNTVHSTQLINTVTRQPYRLPLNFLMRNFMFMASQSNTQRFAKIVQRYGPHYKLTQLIFTTGNIVEMGPVNFEVKRALVHLLVDIMRKQGLPNVAIGRRMCQNIVSAGMLRFPVRLWVLKARFGDNIIYDPALFPGATIRDPALQTALRKDDGGGSGGGGDDDDSHGHALDDERALPDTTMGVALATLRDPNAPFKTIDTVADERLDDPEAMRAANDYARAFLARMSAEGIEAPCNSPSAMLHGQDPSEFDHFGDLVDEQLSKQDNKNIVGLIFGNGCFISGGSKNVRMQRRACAIMYQMLVHCQDTPENRALEEAYLKEHGITAVSHGAAPTSGTTPGTAAAVGKRKRGRPPGMGNSGPKKTPAKKARKSNTATTTPTLAQHHAPH